MNAPLLIESNFETETICEEVKGQKNWYVQGIFMQADVANRNHRMYPKTVMESAIDTYSKNFIVRKRSIGELNHPATPIVNPERASHIIESIKCDGRNYIGKARVLNTPMGNIVRGLLEGGVQLGVSSRGTGSTVPNGTGINVVQPDFNLATIDIVYNPSAPDAFVQGLMEGKDFVWNTTEEDMQLLEQIKAGMKKTSKKNLAEAQVAAFQKFLHSLKI